METFCILSLDWVCYTSAIHCTLHKQNITYTHKIWDSSWECYFNKGINGFLEITSFWSFKYFHLCCPLLCHTSISPLWKKLLHYAIYICLNYWLVALHNAVPASSCCDTHNNPLLFLSSFKSQSLGCNTWTYLERNFIVMCPTTSLEKHLWVWLPTEKLHADCTC